MAAEEVDLVDMVGREPDERLLDGDIDQLPGTAERPPPPSRSRARRRVVAPGVTLTAVTLLGGLGLVIAAVIAALSGGLTALAIAALIIGIIFVATHWGWVHVAEIFGRSIEDRQQAETVRARRQWLASVQPRSRWSVSTRARPDGTIAIETSHDRPMPAGPRSFTFKREVVAREVHLAEEPAAVVAERAELLRRQAAADTERERRRYEQLHSELVESRLGQQDERERLSAARTTSEALSKQINRHLRDPPLSD